MRKRWEKVIAQADSSENVYNMSMDFHHERQLMQKNSQIQNLWARDAHFSTAC
jgi:hypothetical protein